MQNQNIFLSLQEDAMEYWFEQFFFSFRQYSTVNYKGFFGCCSLYYAYIHSPEESCTDSTLVTTFPATQILLHVILFFFAFFAFPKKWMCCSSENSQKVFK